MIGRTIAHYRVVSRLGAGGMGTVYRAQHTALSSRVVALKVLSDAVASQPQLRERFLREAEIMGSLHHENIVMMHDFLAVDGLYAIVMELVPGQTLDRWAGPGPVAFERAAPLIRQILAALQHAHQHGVVHRDVKPSNVIVTPEGQVKVTDFGIARLAQSSDLTQTGFGMGTPRYMSPEQIQGRRHAVGPASDIYSCGVLVHRLLAGRVPFDAEEDAPFAILQAHVTKAPPPLRQLVADVPAEVETAVLCALAKRPEERWATCTAFSHALGLEPADAVARAAADMPAPTRPPDDDATLLPGPTQIGVPSEPASAGSDRPAQTRKLTRAAPLTTGETPRPSTSRRGPRLTALAALALLAVGGAWLVATQRGKAPPLAQTRETEIQAPAPSPPAEPPAPVAPAAEEPAPAAAVPTPSPHEAALLRAETQIDAGSPAAALATLAPVLQAEPGNARALALRQRANALSQRALDARAAEEQRMREARHREASAKVDEARGLLEKGKIELALRAADEALRLEPRSAEAIRVRDAAERERRAAREAWSQGAAGSPQIQPEESR